jgi:hypothetical protein
MPTPPTKCEGCPEPPSNKLPISERDLYMVDGSTVIAFLCPECIAVEDGNSSEEKYRLRTRVKHSRGR